MANNFIGEIRMFGGTFAPAGWAFCDGQLLPISGNDVLFSLIGTTYGGDGQSTFGLPDLRGRAPVHQGPSFQMGSMSGAEQVTLTVAQTPAHTHSFSAGTTAGSQASPASRVPAVSQNVKLYINDSPDKALNAAAISTAPGGSQPHDNRQPYLVVNFIIALQGIFPSHP